MSSMIAMTRKVAPQKAPIVQQVPIIQEAPIIPIVKAANLVDSFNALNVGPKNLNVGSTTSAATRTAITNVRVFDGTSLSAPRTVVIEGDHFGVNSIGATIVNGNGGILIPGLIDAHVHVADPSQLAQLRSFGVTTGLDMEAWPPEVVYALRQVAGQGGLADFRTAQLAAMHNRFGMPPEGHVENAAAAGPWVADRISQGADYIKIIADQKDAMGHPGLDQDTLNALVSSAHGYGKFTVAHVTALDAVKMSQKAKVDMLTHTPLGDTLDNGIVQRLVQDKTVFIPTLIMMKLNAETGGPDGYQTLDADISKASASVAAANKAGVPILAGTDANTTPAPIGHPAYGDSLHTELELLVEAGLSTKDALRAATILPARYFGLWDRGLIAPGRRADVVLLSKNPLDDIKNTRSIVAVWAGGVQWTA